MLTIGLPGDKVVMCILRKECFGTSYAETLTNNRLQMQSSINAIQIYVSTPSIIK